MERDAEDGSHVMSDDALRSASGTPNLSEMPDASVTLSVEHSLSHSSSEKELATSFIERFLAENMASLELTRPEMLRAVYSFVVLNSFGFFFRHPERATHSVSFVASKITEFWSHSWHGSKWQKIVTMFLVKNSFAALIAGA
ncbi:Uncharacterized protein SCF082_LOCUS32883, partial [Durusdinium trenchii]